MTQGRSGLHLLLTLKLGLPGVVGVHGPHSSLKWWLRLPAHPCFVHACAVCKGCVHACALSWRV